MTLIAYTKNYGIPILMGDILSTTESEMLSPNIPTILKATASSERLRRTLAPD